MFSGPTLGRFARALLLVKSPSLQWSLVRRCISKFFKPALGGYDLQCRIQVKLLAYFDHKCHAKNTVVHETKRIA